MAEKTLNQPQSAAGETRKDPRGWLSEIKSLEDRLIALKHALVEEAALPIDEARDDGNVTFLLLSVVDRLIAAPISQIEEVVQMVALVEIPEQTRGIRGLLDYHGTMLAVVDMRHSLGLVAAEENVDRAIVVCRVEGHQFALLVDEATDVFTLRKEEVRVSDEVMPGAFRAVGVFRFESRTAIIIDLWSLSMAAQVEGHGTAEARGAK
ncbi:MAG: chemotaxis protein CheW [Myxococcota bacterium]|jgi:purine-binding chemotaxis protein CheW|nr:chemotaxis protein CheW [Myxococcota bacterium]